MLRNKRDKLNLTCCLGEPLSCESNQAIDNNRHASLLQEEYAAIRIMGV